MATFEPDVISVQLLYGTVGISEAAFNIPMILSTHSTTNNRADIYTDLQSVLDAGYLPESPVATMASLLFAGIAKPSQIVVGRRALDEHSVTLTTAVVDQAVFSVKLKTGTTTKTFSYTATVPTDDTAAVLGALQTAIDGDATFGPLTNTTINGSALEISPVTSTTDFFDVAGVTNTTSVANTTESVADALAAVQGENDSWFWMLSDSHSDVDCKAAALFAEGNDRIYALSSQDADIKNDVMGNTLQDLSELGYRNTWFTQWATDADTTFPEAGAVGAIASALPGTTTMHGKTLAGVSVNDLTATEIQNILNWNGNVYLREYGVNFYRDGRVVNGDFVDTVHFALWMKARTAESLFGLLKRKSDLLDKVAFTGAGLELIRSTIFENPINVGIGRGAIVNEITTDSDGNSIDLRPIVDVPLRGDIPTNDIANRTLNDVNVEVVYASPIHYVKVKVGIILNR